MMTVKNMLSPRTGHEVTNQFIIHDNEANKYVFQSYDSVCAVVTNGKLELLKDFDYSVTTSKYCKQFIQDYFDSDIDKIWKAAKAGQRVFEI